MKKVLLLAAIVFFATAPLTSCKSRKGDKCPAYSQATESNSEEVAMSLEK